MNNSYEKFLNFIFSNNLLSKNDRILVAFSGGKDSVFLTHLLIKNKFNIALAHLNHNLRGEESLRDMKFCIDFAENYNIQIFTRSANIKEIAKRKKMSIEEAARYERYRFLQEIANDYNYNKIATAHHLNDQVETFFINFFRKKSLFALKGINIVQNKIVRPVLCFTRDEIESYIKNENLNFVEDSSNFDTNFFRNKIRLSLVPFIEKGLNLDLKSIVKFYQGKISEIEDVLNFIISEIFHNAIENEDNGFSIILEKLNDFWNFKIIRFEIYKNILIDFDVNYSKKLLENIDKFILSKQRTGKFYTHNLKIFKEYNKIFFTYSTELLDYNELIIEKTGDYVFENYKITLKEIDLKDVNYNEKAEFLDVNKVKFPLKVRFFKPGDRFIPLGMSKSVKLKKFFINCKIPFRYRRKIPIIEDSEGEIIIIGNLRISEKVKIDDATKNVLIFKILLN